MAVNAKLTNSFTAAAKSIFDAMITDNGEYFQEKDDYDPVTGAEVPGATEIIRMARVTLDDQELANLNLKIGSVKFIFLQEETTIEPTQSGKIVYEGIDYKVVRIKRDPANILWIVYASER